MKEFIIRDREGVSELNMKIVDSFIPGSYHYLELLLFQIIFSFITF